MNMIQVVVADDHPVVRGGIRHLLEQSPDIRVAGEARDGNEALRLAVELAPDVLVLDMTMPGMTGPDVARQLRTVESDVRVLALSAFDDEQYISGLLDGMVAGYLTKDEAPERVVEAVRGVARGERGWVSPRVAAKLLGREVPGSQERRVELARLSTRERQVLRLLAAGADNARIAGALGIAQGTVKNHVTSIYARIEVRTRAEAVAWAWRHGVVTDGASELGADSADSADHEVEQP